MQKRVPTYQFSYSKTVKGKYYANACPGFRMLSGDDFLHPEPGAPFFRHAQRKLVYFLSRKSLCQGRCTIGLVSRGNGRLILKHAKRIPQIRPEYGRQTRMRPGRKRSRAVQASVRFGKPESQLKA